MLGMFKNKVLLRVKPPSPPLSFFSLFQISLTLLSPLSPSLSSNLHSLCWTLSRLYHFACFFVSSHISLVFQKTQFESAARVVKEIQQKLPASVSVSDVELVGDGDMSGSLISKALDCSLRSLLLESGWKCVGDGYIVKSSFSHGEERSPVFALHVGVCQLGTVSDLPSWTKPLNDEREQLLMTANSAYKRTIVEGELHSFKSLFPALDYRTSKPALRFYCSKEDSKRLQIQGKTIPFSNGTSDSNETHIHTKQIVSVGMATKVKPVFMVRVPATRRIHLGIESEQICQSSTNSKAKDLQEHDHIQKPISKDTGVKDRDKFPEPIAKDLKPKEYFATQGDGVSQQINSRISKQKGVKRINTGLEETRKEDVEQSMTKKRVKHQSDSSDITAKVTGHHARDQLGSLTVPELKSFLGLRKAKVGGKKEELIQRIMTLLA